MDKTKLALATKDESLKKFLTEFTFILNVICDKNKKDVDIEAIKDGFMIARKENPECILIKVGPYVWKYREIMDDVNKLLSYDFSKELDRLANVENEKVKVILIKIKKTWGLFTKLEQDLINKKMKMIISNYATYVGACKQLKQ